jgi:hypothetical protein
MEISHELVLQPADIYQFSIQCESCHAELALSLSTLSLSGADRASKEAGHPDMPTRCPSCEKDWSDLYGLVRDFRAILEGLKEYRVSFRVPEPERYSLKAGAGGG